MTALASLTAALPGRARPARAAVKTGTYAVMHLVVAVSVAFALTGDWRAALAIGMIEPLVQTGAYAAHEKAWARADFALAGGGNKRVKCCDPC